MYTFFCLQITISQITFNQKAARLNTSFFTFLKIKNSNLKALLFSPARIHAIQHARPVHGFCSASPWMKFQDSIVFIVWMRKQDIDFKAFKLLHRFCVFFFQKHHQFFIK